MDLAERFAEIFAGRDDSYGLTYWDGREDGWRVECVRTPFTSHERRVALFRDHLEGRQDVGIYPVRPDNTCRWGCVDIDFDDFEPGMDSAAGTTLAACPHFTVDRLTDAAGEAVANRSTDRFSILSVVRGNFQSAHGRTYGAGDTILMSVGAAPMVARDSGEVLEITVP